MKKLLTLLLILIGMLCSNQSQAQEGWDSLFVRFNSVLSINAFNIVTFRPQICYEVFVEPRMSIQASVGYIFPNSTLQKSTAFLHHQDSYLFSGYHVGGQFRNYGKRYPELYLALRVYYKNMGYSNKVFNDGRPAEHGKAKEYVTSNTKQQFNISIERGGFKIKKDNIIINTFFGGGLIFVNQSMTYHERHYDNSLILENGNGNPPTVIDQPVPYTIDIKNILPNFHFGVRIGLGFGKKVYDSLQFGETPSKEREGEK